jgi:hypothetical protein
MQAASRNCWNPWRLSSGAGDGVMSKRPKSSGAGPTDAASTALRAQARAAAGEAFDQLLELARSADSESVQLGAIKELLDRGLGRAGQSDNAAGVIAHVLVDNGYGS